jgi:hypothetical protein
LNRVPIPRKQRPLLLAMAAACVGLLMLSCCCGGYVLLLRGERTPVVVPSARKPEKLNLEQLPADVVAKIDQIVPATDEGFDSDTPPDLIRAPFEIEVPRLLTQGPASDRIITVLRDGTLKDFMELRAEERLSLCHRVANQLHPERSSAKRAARARTFFDLLQMVYYLGDAKSLVKDRLMLIETQMERGKKANDKLTEKNP